MSDIIHKFHFIKVLAFSSKNMCQLSGGFAQLSPCQGLCPLTPLEAQPSDSYVGTRARHKMITPP